MGGAAIELVRLNWGWLSVDCENLFSVLGGIGGGSGVEELPGEEVLSVEQVLPGVCVWCSSETAGLGAVSKERSSYCGEQDNGGSAVSVMSAVSRVEDQLHLGGHQGWGGEDGRDMPALSPKVW